MEWGFDTLFVLFGLLLVLEGFMPALSPEAWRKMLLRFATSSDAAVRSMGVTSMVIGAVIVTLVHNWDLLPEIDMSMLNTMF